MSRLLPWTLTLLGAAIYANSLTGPFVFDDVPTILENTYYRHPWPPWNLLSAPTQMPVAGRPFVCLSLALNYALGGLSAPGFRVFNLAIHIACALALFSLIRRTLLTNGLRGRFHRDADAIAFVCALVWMAHPLTSECVNYITQRTDSMMALFYLLTLYCVLRSASAAGTRIWFALAISSCVSAMGCKESAVTLPVMALLYDRTFIAGSFKEALRDRWKLHLALALTWLGLAALMATGPRSETVGFALGLGPLDYFKNQSVVLAEYLRLAVWPHPLALDYGYPVHLTFREILPQASFLTALAAASFAAVIWRPPIGFLGAWFFIVLAPTSSFVPIVSEVGADRRMYLPLAGLATLGVVAIHAAMQMSAQSRARRMGMALAVVVVLALSATTVRRNAQYGDAVTIWRTAVAARPHNHRAHSNLGSALKSAKRPAEAVAHYERAIQINPHFVDAYSNLCGAYADLSELEKAVEICEFALRLDPNHALTLNYLGIVLKDKGQLDEAIALFRRAVEIKPDFAAAHKNLSAALRDQGQIDAADTHLRRSVDLCPYYGGDMGSLALSLFVEGRLDEAIAMYRLALEHNDDVPETHSNFAIALQDRGMLDEAIEHGRKAVRLAPDSAEAHNSLASALLARGDLEEATESFRRAVELKPGNNSLVFNLASALDRLGFHEKAAEHFRRVCQLEPESAQTYNKLGTMLGSLGRLDEAIECFRQALRIEPGFADAEHNLASTLRMRNG